MVDDVGYLKLIDFGVAKQTQRGTRNFTLCGSPEYTSPEIISGEGHNMAADWWSFGVLMFLCN